MKKLLVAFGIGISIFFAGFSFAENDQYVITCDWGELKGDERNENPNPSLQSACNEAKAFSSASKWVKKGEEFKKGKEIIDKIKGDLGENEEERTYSELELERMYIEATDFFINAEKLARKPVIHSGGILPGPGDAEDGTDYVVNKIITKFINGSLVLLFSIGILMLIIGGLMFLFSAGDSEQLTKAKDTVLWGITGIIIAVMAYTIVKFIVGLDFGF